MQELQADQLRLSHLRENVRRLELQDQARKQAQLEKANTAGDPPAGLPDLREYMIHMYPPEPIPSKLGMNC
jgi:hypothetical protein